MVKKGAYKCLEREVGESAGVCVCVHVYVSVCCVCECACQCACVRVCVSVIIHQLVDSRLVKQNCTSIRHVCVSEPLPTCTIYYICVLLPVP